MDQTRLPLRRPRAASRLSMFALVALVGACMATGPRQNDPMFGDTNLLGDYGDFIRDKDRWSGALAAPRSLPVVTLGLTAALLQVNGADHRLQAELASGRRESRFPGTTLRASDVGLVALSGTEFVLPLLHRPEGPLGSLPYLATAAETWLWTAGLTEGLRALGLRRRPNGRSGSFPSGHASHAFAAATLLDLEYGHRVGIPAYLAASAVGYYRIQGNHHYPGDVLAGAALGILIARLVHRKDLGEGGYFRRRARVAASPIVNDRQVGVGVSVRW